LVTLFSDVLAKIGGTVVVADADGLAATAHMGVEAFRLPRVAAANYEEAVLELVEEQGISAIIPTIDTELAALSQMAGSLDGLGCRAIVSGAELLGVAADKEQTSQAFGKAGFQVPRSWSVESALSDESLPENLFVKPRFGSASQGAQAVSREQLPLVLAGIDRPIVQENITAEEVTVDALLDFDGKPVHYVPRSRLKTLGGESVQGVTIDDQDISEWIMDVLHALSDMGGMGPLTIQYFATVGGPTLLEVNPRFGGGFPLGHAAGGLYPEWIVSALIGEPMQPRLGEYERGLYMTRALAERFVRHPKW